MYRRPERYILFPRHSSFRFFYSRFRTVGNIILIFDDFGADKAFFEVGMDHTGTLRSFPTFLVSPGTHFLYAGSEVSFEIQNL